MGGSHEQSTPMLVTSTPDGLQHALQLSPLDSAVSLPLSVERWLECLSRCKSVSEIGIGLAWGFQNGVFLNAGKAEPPQTSLADGRVRGLFPLPIPKLPVIKWPLQGVAPGDQSFSIECWLAVSCRALNLLYGCCKDARDRKDGKVHAAALNGMRDKLKRFLAGDQHPGSHSFLDVTKDLREKRISYTGEEISQPLPLSVSQILTAGAWWLH